LAPSFEDARYTLLSNVALTVFYPIVIPFVAGALAGVVRPQELIGVSAGARAILAGLAVLVVGAALYVLVADSNQALNERVIEPIEFKSPELRAYFFEVNDRLRKDPTSAAASLKCEASMTNPYWASQCYMAVTRAKFGKDATGKDVTITLSDHMGLAS